MPTLNKIFDKCGVALYQNESLDLDHYYQEPYQDEGDEIKVIGEPFETDKSKKIRKYDLYVEDRTFSNFSFFMDGSRRTYKIGDIVIDGKKIAGICTESIGQFGADRPDAVVLGIGINVSTQNFPAEIAETAGSLGVFVDRNALAAACVDNVFDMLSGIADATFMDEYRAECMTIGKQVDVFSGDKYLYSAKALEIDDDGLLIVQKESGETVSLITQEVSIKNRK